jgi:hypothetical protein
LPRALKDKPTINCVPKRPSEKPSTSPEKKKKSKPKQFLPYVAETGTITFIPKGGVGVTVPKMKVKAVKGNTMVITNLQEYAGKKHILIDGDSIPKECKDKTSNPKSASTQIQVLTKEKNYNCVLSS